MRVFPFIAETPAAALAQIQAQLGPEAVVLSMRPVPAAGLSRLWRKNRGVEVLASLPAEQGRAHDCRSRREEAPQRFGVPPSGGSGYGVPPSGGSFPQPAKAGTPNDYSRPHVFIGPPGVGKSTLLCKWLTLAVLTQAQSARVWRLDGFTANVADFLNIYGEMLGVPVERSCHPIGATSDLLLVDLPGVEAGDLQAMNDLKARLATLRSPHVHLVLNAAYDSAILREQFDAFAPFTPEDVSFTHLDEEKRLEKLQDLCRGINCSVRFLGGGQKIPGDFRQAGVSSATSGQRATKSGPFELSSLA